MPISRLSDIAVVHPPIRRITGSADLPLSADGVKQAQELGERLAGKFTKVFASPARRAMQTARAIDPKAEPDHFLGPIRMGKFEGRPAQEMHPQIADHLANKPHESFGKSPFSGKQGESPDQARRRILGRVHAQLSGLKKGQKVLDLTHGRNIRMVHAWIKNGAPKDLSISAEEMTSTKDPTPPGDILHVNMREKRLSEVKVPEVDGLYLGRHAKTIWSEGGGTAS